MSCRGCSSPGTATCARCKAAAYCGREHQIAHWNAHKAACAAPCAPAPAPLPAAALRALAVALDAGDAAEDARMRIFPPWRVDAGCGAPTREQAIRWRTAAFAGILAPLAADGGFAAFAASDDGGVFTEEDMRRWREGAQRGESCAQWRLSQALLPASAPLGMFRHRIDAVVDEAAGADLLLRSAEAGNVFGQLSLWAYLSSRARGGAAGADGAAGSRRLLSAATKIS